MEPEKLKILKDYYYNPLTGFQSADKLYHKVKDQDISRNEVIKFVKQQATHQLHTRSKPKRLQAPIFGKVGTYQSDLTFLTQYKKQNKGFHILLVCVEVNTKKAYVEALKSKTGKSIAEALTKIISRAEPKMTVLETDNGGEFLAKEVKELCKNHKIRQTFTQTNDKSALGIAERFNRTIKGIINRYLTYHNTTEWVDKLQSFVDNYNSTYHSSIDEQPNNITIEREKEIIQDKIDKNMAIKAKNKIKVGDFVRLPNKKGLFTKEGQNYSNEIFKVEKVNVSTLEVAGRASRYKIADILPVSGNSEAIPTTKITKAKKDAKVSRIITQQEKLPENYEEQIIPTSSVVSLSDVSGKHRSVRHSMRKASENVRLINKLLQE